MPRYVGMLAAVWAVLIVAVTTQMDGGAPPSQALIVGNVAILSAIVFCLGACVRAACGPVRPAWPGR